MFRYLQIYLNPSGLQAIVPETLRHLLKWLLFLRVIILSILLGTSVLLQTKTHVLLLPPLDYVAYFIAGVYFFTILSALSMRLLKDFHRMAVFQSVCDVLLAAFIVYATGGSQSIFTIIYFLPIVSGSFILLRLGGLLMAALSTISYGFILLVELLYDHWFLKDLAAPLKDPIVAMHFFAIHGIVFFFIANLCVIVFERMRRTETALFQSNLDYDRLYNIYKQVFDDITTGIVTTDGTGGISSINRAAEKICGRRSGEVIGRGFEKVFPGIETGLSDGQPFRQMVEITTSDGKVVPVGYSWARLNLPGSQEECRVYTMQDLSQIRAMEKQVKQAEKMATVGGMAAGIAHEFRNPLAAVSGAAQMLMNEDHLSAASRKLVEIITRESNRLEGTIDDFLLFSKPSEPDREWFPLGPMIDETISLLKQNRKWPSHNCLTANRVPGDLECWGDPRQLQQVMLNLISNACQAMADQGGEIDISSGLLENGEGGDSLVITVSDNGPGIPEAIREAIFEPFFTTRENGTGLGLAIVRQLVESHDGSTAVQSETGRGTRFTVTLPLPPH